MSSYSRHIDAFPDTERGNYETPLHGLAALRIIIVIVIGLGYASTMGLGPSHQELGNHWGYDPSWYGIQMLFILSGFLAARSMANGHSIFGFFRSRTLSIWPALIGATLVTVCIIYPLMCAPNADVRMSVGNLATYLFNTVFLINPGAPMPGLLDDAKYMCLLQGAIWTLRIGLILHVAFLLGWMARILQNRYFVLTLSFLAISIYVLLVDTAVKDPESWSMIEPLFPTMRLGYAYLIGVAVFHWQDKLRLNIGQTFTIAAFIALITTASFLWLPWSSALEVMGVTMWFTICFGFLQNAPRAFQRCPRLTPVFYVSIWPTSQIVISLLPEISQLEAVLNSIALTMVASGVLYVLFRQARIQPARF